MKTLVRLAAVVLAMALFSLGCSYRRASVRQSDESHVASHEPARLVVQISNVTDDHKNRRNQVELFVNGKKLTPANNGNRGEYLYELTLRSGVHKIHGKYRAKSFWKDKEFKLATHDGRVRLYSGYTTFLTMTLEKKSDGSLLHDKVFFTEAPRLQRANAKPQIAQVAAPAPQAIEQPRAVFIPSKVEEQKAESVTPAIERPILVVPVAPQALASAPIAQPAASNDAPVVSLDRVAAPVEAPTATPQIETTSATVSVERVAPVETSPQVNVAPIASTHVEAAALALGKIALQINTSPANADVIVDDRYLGQSPLVAHVERGRSHVIQISKKGYADKIKLIDRSEFGTQQTYFLIEKLEKEEE